ncbi:MAG: hypothetical protein HZA50_09620 [Planctomycetes bacterium]|nr:hypothetical protein [Planctomycetota bacterium]
MPIRFLCGKDGCGQSIQAPDAAAGKKVRCPRCGAIIAVPHHISKPGEPEMLTFDDEQPVRQAGPQGVPPTAQQTAKGAQPARPTMPPAPQPPPVPRQQAQRPGAKPPPPAAAPRVPPPVVRPQPSVKAPPVGHQPSASASSVIPPVAGLAGRNEPETVGFADEPPVQAASAAGPPTDGAGSAGGIIYCPECGRLMREDKVVCPECGWVRGAPVSAGGSPRPAAAAPPTPWHQPQPLSPVGLAAECVKAVKYGASNYTSVAVMVGYSIVLIYILQTAFFFILAILMFSAVGLMLTPVVLLFMFVLLGGYYFRFSLDCIVSSLEGTDLAPDPPALNFSSLWTTGWRAVGICLIYVLPVVTLPLLPLSLLALGYSNDNRCFSVAWAFRAAMKKPGHLAMLWLVLLLWIVIMTIGVGLVQFAVGLVLAMVKAGTGSGFVVFMVSIPGNILIAIINYVFIAVIFRCIGLLGRCCPELTDMLPEQVGAGATAGYVSAGLAASVLASVATAAILAFATGTTFWDRLSHYTASGQYSAATSDTSRMRLAGVGNLITTYSFDPAHLGQFPRNLAELENLTPDKTIFESPGMRGSKFVYIPGQFQSEKTENNILLYDPAVYYDPDRDMKVINVLLVGGDVDSIPAGELIGRLVSQKAGPASRPATEPDDEDEAGGPASMPAFEMRDSSH